MRKLAIGLGISIGNLARTASGLIWRNWTTGWTSLNNTWNSYK